MSLECHMPLTGAAVAVLIAGLLVIGCSESRHTIRSIDQHPTDDFSTMETSTERVVELAGAYRRAEHENEVFWGCVQTEGKLRCDRVCRDGWATRLCEPRLNDEFGRVQKPSAGVAVSNYRRMVERRARKSAEEDAEAEAEDVADDREEEP